MVAVKMASSSLALRPRASSSRPLGPPRAAARAALPTPRPPATQLSVERRESSAGETRLYSLAPYPLLLPGAESVTAAFQPFVDIVKTFDLPDWLVHWGHPGNMAVVLFAMGGYGTYLGFRIKLSDDPAGGEGQGQGPPPEAPRRLLTSGKPIFESPHAVTGIIGLGLLTVQSLLPTLFEGNPGLRGAHGLLGSSIMTLFLFHAAFGLQLGLSF